MTNFKSLVSGVGNLSKTTKYYDDWSENYDETLNLWNYQAPKKIQKRSARNSATNVGVGSDARTGKEARAIPSPAVRRYAAKSYDCYGSQL